MEEIITPKYLSQSNHVFLDRKNALYISRILRKTAEKVEKHFGAMMVLDESGSTLITAYRKLLVNDVTDKVGK
jgi:hypothetical protein